MIDSNEVIRRFLNDDVTNNEIYEDLVKFINSQNIRNGEYECNYFIIKKLDLINFVIYAENIYPDNHREIPYSTSIYKNILIEALKNHVKNQGFI